MAIEITKSRTSTEELKDYKVIFFIDDNIMHTAGIDFEITKEDNEIIMDIVDKYMNTKQDIVNYKVEKKEVEKQHTDELYIS